MSLPQLGRAGVHSDFYLYTPNSVVSDIQESGACGNLLLSLKQS